jgi:hypothetical protein
MMSGLRSVRAQLLGVALVAGYATTGLAQDWYAYDDGSALKGVNGPVTAVIELPDCSILVGGAFSDAGSRTNLGNLARWNGSSWTTIGTLTGTNGAVRAMVMLPNGNVAIGGAFSQLPTPSFAVNNIAIYSQSAGTIGRLSAGFPNYGTGGAVLVLAVQSTTGHLIVGGQFTTVGGTTVPANRIARWTGTAWQAIGTGFNNDVLGLACDPVTGDIIAAGAFTQLGGGGSMQYVAKWNGTAWMQVGSPPNSFATSAAFSSSNELYVGGNFTLPHQYAMQLSGNAWQPVLNPPTSTVIQLVAALGGIVAVGSSGPLIISDNSSSGGSTLPTLAGIGRSIGVNHRGGLIVGGSFTATSLGTPVTNVAAFGLGIGGCGDVDFNNDLLFPDDSDIADFLAVLAGGQCSTGYCDSIDFNGDCIYPSDQDVLDFLTVLAGGTPVGC